MAAVNTGSKSIPKEAQIMAAILKDMGVNEYEPRVLNQMMEFSYRYLTDVLEDAKLCSSHANKKSIDLDDIKMAIQFKLDHSYTNPPPRDLLMDVARHKNSVPLPLIKPFTGPKLPPDRYCFTAPNYRLKSQNKVQPKVQVQPGSVLQSPGVAPRIVLAAPYETYGGMSASPSMRLMAPSITHPGMGVRPSPTVRPLSNATPGVRMIPAGATAAAAAATLTSIPAVSMPTAPTPKRKREDDDDYDLT